MEKRQKVKMVDWLIIFREEWIEKHPIISIIIAFSIMIVCAFIMVWVFKIGWDTIPPTINEIVEHISNR